MLLTMKAEEANTMARVTLSSIGLPAKLESYKSGGTLPDHVWEKLLKIQGIGGIDTLRLKLTELNTAAEGALVTARTIDSALQRQEEVDVNFRSRHPTWTGPPTSSLNLDIKLNLARLKDAHSAARLSDTQIAKEIKDLETGNVSSTVIGNTVVGLGSIGGG